MGWTPPKPPTPFNKNRDFAPTEKDLERYPSLKEAWEEYLIVKRLLGV